MALRAPATAGGAAPPAGGRAGRLRRALGRETRIGAYAYPLRAMALAGGLGVVAALGLTALLLRALG
ncbi:MAG: hypothetical protein GC157_04370 [Frankiales bacterium]|nr:hypothetical protein [Frankiales bacterium]